MSRDKLNANVATAEEALRSFLTTLLGADSPLSVEAPASTEFDDVNLRSKANIVFTAGTSPDTQWAVVLDPSWLPIVSKSMLGEPISFGEPGADDLLKEVASQAYGAVRTQLSSDGEDIADASIELLPRGEDLGSSRFSPDLMETPFSLTFDGQELTGFAIIPLPPPEGIPTSDDEEEVEEIDSPEADDISIADELASLDEGPKSRGVEVAKASFPNLGNETIGDGVLEGSFSLLADVELEVTVELGRRRIPLADVLRLTTGSVIELEKLVGEPLEVYANGRLIAEGEAVVMDEQFGIRITSLASNRQKAKAFV